MVLIAQLGNDIRKMDTVALSVVKNKDALDISQDPLGVQAQRVWSAPGTSHTLNRTDWDGINGKEYDVLRGYLRNVSETLEWNPGQCLPAFPSSGNHKDVEILQNMVGKAKKVTKPGHPVAVDDPDPLGRLEETLAGRTNLCVYDERIQKLPAIHFQCNHKKKLRMLVHFYAFLFFEDWKEDLWMKRFVRDRK